MNIELVVTAFSGQFSETYFDQLILENLPLSSYPSKGTLALRAAESSPFYNLSEVVTIDFNGAEVSFDLDGNPIDFSLGEDSEDNYKDFEVQSDKVIIYGNLREGINELVISFIDREGKTFSKPIVFFSGSRSIDINLINASSEESNKSASVHFIDFPKNSFRYESLSPKFTLKNVPNIEGVLIAKDLEFSKIENLELGDIGTKDIMMSPIELAKNYDNHNFSLGLEGWFVENGEGTLIPKITGNFYNDPNGNSLRLAFDPNGEVRLRTLISGDSEGTPFAELPIKFSPEDGEAFLVARVKNKSDGKETVSVMRAKQVNSSNLLGNNFLNSLPLGNLTAGGPVEIEFFSKLKKGLPSVSYFDRIINSILPEIVYASSGGGARIDILGVNKTNLLLSNLVLLDNQKHHIFDELISMVEAPFPDSYDNKKVINGVNTKTFDFLALLDIKGEVLDSTNLYLLICSENVLFETLANCSNTLLKKENFNFVNDLSLTEDKLKFTDNAVRVCVVGYDNENNLLGHTCMQENLPLKVSLSGRDIVGGQNVNVDVSVDPKLLKETRYGSRQPSDNIDGGDDWIAKTHLSEVSKILGFFTNFTTNFNGVRSKVKMDDASAAGVSGPSPGFGHSSHKLGLKIDVRFQHDKDEELGGLSDLKRVNREVRVKSLWDARNLHYLLDHNSGLISKALIYHDKEDDDAKFTRYTRSTVLKSCELMTEVVGSAPKHGDHIDLKMNEVRNGVVSKTDLCNYAPVIQGGVSFDRLPDSYDYRITGLPENTEFVKLS